jgi:hypothetical protein
LPTLPSGPLKPDTGPAVDEIKEETPVLEPTVCQILPSSLSVGPSAYIIKKVDDKNQLSIPLKGMFILRG